MSPVGAPGARERRPTRTLSAAESPDLVFFSSVSENTRRFVDKLDRPVAQKFFGDPSLVERAIVTLAECHRDGKTVLVHCHAELGRPPPRRRRLTTASITS